MRDLTSFASMKLKAALFVVVGMFSGGLLVFGATAFTAWQRALLLAMCVWAFCRAYYFAFYVIEKYVDPGFKFSGLGMAVRYLLTKRPPTGQTTHHRPMRIAKITDLLLLEVGSFLLCA